MFFEPVRHVLIRRIAYILLMSEKTKQVVRGFLVNFKIFKLYVQFVHRVCEPLPNQI